MKRSGFTMIELIFVIVILGILAAVAIPKLASLKDDATLATAAQSYCSDTVRGKLGTISQLKGTLEDVDVTTIIPLKENWSATVSATTGNPGIPAGTYSTATLSPTLTNSTSNIYVYYVDANDSIGNSLGCFVSNADGTTLTISGDEANTSLYSETSIIYK